MSTKPPPKKTKSRVAAKPTRELGAVERMIVSAMRRSIRPLSAKERALDLTLFSLPLVKNPRGGKMLPVRKRLGMSREAFAPLVATSPRKLADIEKGKAPGEAVRRNLVQLDRVADALATVVDESAIGPWMLIPNPAFGDLKPAEVIQRGDIDRIWQMIFLLRSSAPS